MRSDIWEDFISLNSRLTPEFEVLGPAAQYRDQDTHTDWSGEQPLLDIALAKDVSPLPTTQDREGYYGPHHFSYWASGFRDARLLRECCARLGVPLRDYLDLGCASGRVIRHMATNNPEIDVLGCDINRKHVEWVSRYLPSIKVFQNHSIPTLPIPDNSLDLVSAFSVFTHIEAFESTWLMELRRILRPGGLAWITLHTERTWRALAPGWPLLKALEKHPDFSRSWTPGSEMPAERLVFRWQAERSYSSNVFYTTAYIRRVWGSLLEVVEDHHRPTGFQDAVVLRKA